MYHHMSNVKEIFCIKKVIETLKKKLYCSTNEPPPSFRVHFKENGIFEGEK